VSDVDTIYKSIEDDLAFARRAVENAGGRGSRLWRALTEAGMYCAGNHAARRAKPRESWEAMRAVLSYNLPKPDWEEGLAGEGTPLTKCVLVALGGVNRNMEELKTAWCTGTAPEVKRRERFENGRGTLRTILRAWREVTDGVPANAAKWDQRWKEAESDVGGCKLAMRVRFQEGDGVKYYAEEAWLARLLLTWMRLCRAGKVAVARRGSAKWREAERERRSRLHELHKTARQRAGHSRCVETHHQAQERMAEEHGVTSGAAAILERRSRTAEKRKLEGASEGIDGGKRMQARPILGATPQSEAATVQSVSEPTLATPPRGAGAMTEGLAGQKRRRDWSDGALVFSMTARDAFLTHWPSAMR